MKNLIVLIGLFSSALAFGQSETNNFISYDTVISIPTGGQWSTPDRWNVRISRPANMFLPGNTDTASRPAFIMMPGQGEQGTADQSKLLVFGPHFWLANGWDGSVTLSNGKHYPILITVSYINNVYPSVAAYYKVIALLLNTYHVKRNSVHVTGLSQGAFTGGGLVEYEVSPGDQAGMKMVTSLTLFEGEPTRSAAYPTNYSDTVAFKVWASKYRGRFFYFEGNGQDNFRDGWHYATAMNNAVPGSAYFSYEGIGGGKHCCWNSMYDPKATNWTSVGVLGPNNAPSQAGKNQMGNYLPGENVFQWMLRQGDTTLVGSGPVVPPVVVPPVCPVCPTCPPVVVCPPPVVCPKAPVMVSVSVNCDGTACTVTATFDDGSTQTIKTP